MSDKLYQENIFDNFVRPPCAQQPNNMQHYPSYTSSYNMQTHCDYMYGPQTSNKAQATYTPTSFLNPREQLDATNWLPDPRTVADIERGLRFTEKMETIEITSKDLSPASCCSTNLDLLIPDFYKNLKDANFYNKTNVGDSSSQWFCNNKYVEYPSCAQVSSGGNFMTVEDKSTKNEVVAEMMLPDNLYCNYGSLPGLVSQEQFYQANEALSFPDISVDVAAGDVSNDESDIIVEESDEEVTDYSEDLERNDYTTTNCVICNVIYTPIGDSQFFILTDESPLTMSSQEPVHKKLTEMLGVLDKKRNYLCSQCLSLINTIDHLQLKLDSSKFELFNKFEKTCKENNLTFKLPTNKPKTKALRKFKHFCGIHSFKCKLCKRLFSIKKLYENHMRKHKLHNRFLCELCGLRFTKFFKFKSHRRSHMVSSKPKMFSSFPCTICKTKSFRTKTNLKEHEHFCSGNLPYKCKNCDKKFPTVTKLKNHTKLKHDKKFIAICSICNIGFIKISDYKSHKISHNPEKKFNCTQCEKSYKTLSNLNYHMKFHNDKLPFICTICNKGFMRKEYLESHVNNHNGVKNFPCQFCNKKFVSQKNLDAHTKYHEGSVKKKVCNTCNKTITTGFEEHLRTHSNLKEFECEICQMKFNTKGALAKHSKRKHGNES